METRLIPHIAYQVESTSNGGYQLYKIMLDKDNNFVSRAKVEYPDSWDQVISYLELELSRQFA
jgi:hypothetical protein